MNDNFKNELLEYQLTWRGRKPFRKPRINGDRFRKIKSFKTDYQSLKARIELSRKCAELVK